MYSKLKQNYIKPVLVFSFIFENYNISEIWRHFVSHHHNPIILSAFLSVYLYILDCY